MLASALQRELAWSSLLSSSSNLARNAIIQHCQTANCCGTVAIRSSSISIPSTGEIVNVSLEWMPCPRLSFLRQHLVSQASSFTSSTSIHPSPHIETSEAASQRDPRTHIWRRDKQVSLCCSFPFLFLPTVGLYF